MFQWRCFVSTDTPYLNIYLKTADNISSTPKANSSRSGDATLVLLANVTYNTMKNGVNISHGSTMEAYEGYDVPLTFAFECYPPIRAQHWSLPITVSLNNSHSTVYMESYTTKGTRYACYASNTLEAIHQFGLANVAVTQNDITPVADQRLTCCCGEFVWRTEADTSWISSTASSVVH